MCRLPQTVRLLRPFERRFDRMARPARVRMRRRKPCFLCRRRLFGWYVRLLTRLAPAAGLSIKRFLDQARRHPHQVWGRRPLPRAELHRSLARLIYGTRGEHRRSISVRWIGVIRGRSLSTTSCRSEKLPVCQCNAYLSTDTPNDGAFPVDNWLIHTPCAC